MSTEAILPNEVDEGELNGNSLETTGKVRRGEKMEGRDTLEVTRFEVMTELSNH